MAMVLRAVGEGAGVICGTCKEDTSSTDTGRHEVSDCLRVMARRIEYLEKFTRSDRPHCEVCKWGRVGSETDDQCPC